MNFMLETSILSVLSFNHFELFALFAAIMNDLTLKKIIYKQIFDLRMRCY